MKNIVIQIVPFCYGPTSIAIAIGRKLKESIECNITAICNVPSLDLISQNQNIFSNIVYLNDDVFKDEALHLSNLVISICDFDFTKNFLEKFPKKKIVFIDPLLWMWKEIPSIITQCDLYLALEFQGVAVIVSKISNNRVIMIPQVAEFNDLLPNISPKNNILVNLGGMQSPLGSNFPLAFAMCQEIINIVLKNREFESVDIRTSQEISEKLRSLLPKSNHVSIKSTTPKIFQHELAQCKLLLTVPGMSIVYESLMGKIPILFILPLNYSQHLQIKHYRNIFSNISEIKWEDLSGFDELPNNLEESDGVHLANVLGKRFERNEIARKKFRNCLKNKIQGWEKISPLQTEYSLNLTGALCAIDILKKHNLI